MMAWNMKLPASYPFSIADLNDALSTLSLTVDASFYSYSVIDRD